MKRLLLVLCVLCLSACSTTAHNTRHNSEAMNDLAIYAMSLADTPYKYGGNSPESGFDCSGFVGYVFQKKLGRKLPRTSHEISRIGERISKDQLMPGDLVFFNTLGKSNSHVGIYVGEDKFVHSPSSGKSISVVSMKERYWRTRFDGARRISSD